MFSKKALPTGEDLKVECEKRGINVDNIYAGHGAISGDAQRQMQQLILNHDAVGRERLMLTLTGIAVIAALTGTGLALFTVLFG